MSLPPKLVEAARRYGGLLPAADTGAQYRALTYGLANAYAEWLAGEVAESAKRGMGSPDNPDLKEACKTEAKIALEATGEAGAVGSAWIIIFGADSRGFPSEIKAPYDESDGTVAWIKTRPTIEAMAFEWLWRRALAKAEGARREHRQAASDDMAAFPG